VLPQHRHRLALRIVVDAGGAHERCLIRPQRLLNAFDEPAGKRCLGSTFRFGG
jgi:hypothetical protein